MDKDEKSFDEIMDEILGEDDNNHKTDKEEFEEKIFEVSRPYEIIEPSSGIEEVENTIKYKFSNDARIELFNGYTLDTGYGDGYRERTLIQTSHHIEVIGHFNTRDLIIEKHPEFDKFGQIEFNDRQKADSLVVENVGLFGEFDVAIISIKDSSFVDINLDITDRSKCTYLLIDTRFDRVRGSINMTKNFYNQLNDENLDFLLNVAKNSKVDIKVDGILIFNYIANETGDKNINLEYSHIKDMLTDMRIET